MEDPEREAEPETDTVREPGAPALAVAVTVPEGTRMDAVAEGEEDSEGDSEAEGVVRGEALLVVLCEGLVDSVREARGVALSEAEALSEKLAAVVREAAAERVEEPLTLGDRLTEGLADSLRDATGDAEEEAEPPPRPTRLAVTDCVSEAVIEGLMVEDCDTVEVTEPETEVVEEGDTSPLRLADAALEGVREEEEERDSDAEAVEVIDKPAVAVPVRLAALDFVKGAEALCDRLAVREAESHWLLLMVREVSGDRDGEDDTEGDRDMGAERESEGEPVAETDTRVVEDAACVGGGAFVVEGEVEGGADSVDVGDTVLVLLEDGEEDTEGVELGVLDVVTEGVLVFDPDCEAVSLAEPVAVLDDVPDTVPVVAGEGLTDTLAQPVGEADARTLEDADTEPVRLRDAPGEALPEGEPRGEAERSAVLVPEGVRPPVAEGRDEREAEGDTAADSECLGEADTEGVGGLLREMETEPEVVLVPVCELEVEAEPGGAPPAPGTLLFAVGVRSEVRVEVALAEGVFVEEAEAVEEGVALLLCEMLEQPLGEREGSVERVEVVEPVSGKEPVEDTDSVDVTEGEAEGRGLRVEEGEGVTVVDSEGVFDEEAEGDSVRVVRAVLVTLVEAEAEVVAIRVTLPEVEAEGLLLAVVVLEDVSDTEGEPVLEPPPPPFCSGPLVGDTEGVVVLLLEPEREGLGV